MHILFVEVECSLTADMAQIAEYCHKWRLKLSLTKAVSSVFLLHNARAKRVLKITMDGETKYRHDPHPVHVGVTLDSTLWYGERLSKTSS